MIGTQTFILFYFIFSFLTFCRNCEWKWLQTRPKWKHNLSKLKIQKDFVDFNVMEWIICLCNNFLSAQYSQTGCPSCHTFHLKTGCHNDKRKAKHVLWFLFEKILEKNKQLQFCKNEVLHFISIRYTLSDWKSRFYITVIY